MNEIYLSLSLSSFSHVSNRHSLHSYCIPLPFLFLAGAPVVCRQYQKNGWFDSKCKHCGGPKEGHATYLRALAESVGMPVKMMWEGVTRGDGGEIVEINWRMKFLKGKLPVGDMHMPNLRKLDLYYNNELKGAARGVGVTVVKFTDCVCV